MITPEIETIIIPKLLGEKLKCEIKWFTQYHTATKWEILCSDTGNLDLDSIFLMNV